MHFSRFDDECDFPFASALKFATRNESSEGSDYEFEKRMNARQKRKVDNRSAIKIFFPFLVACRMVHDARAMICSRCANVSGRKTVWEKVSLGMLENSLDS